MKRPLNQQRLRELLHYDPQNGQFVRLLAITPACKVGDIAGCTKETGYVSLSVDGCPYLGHRLAWLYMTGAWPPNQVDHINGNKADNRWTNLRAATNSENLQNIKRCRCDSTTGLIGVTPTRSKIAPYWARIRLNNQVFYLGRFATAEAAHAAYIAAKRRLHAMNTL